LLKAFAMILFSRLSIDQDYDQHHSHQFSTISRSAVDSPKRIYILLPKHTAASCGRHACGSKEAGVQAVDHSVRIPVIVIGHSGRR